MSPVMLCPVTRHPGGAPSSESRAEPGLGEKWRLEPGLLVTKCNNVTGAGEGWELGGPGSCRSSALSPLLDPVQALAYWQCPWSAPVLANTVTRTLFIHFSASKDAHQCNINIHIMFNRASSVNEDVINQKCLFIGLIFGRYELMWQSIYAAGVLFLCSGSEAVMINTVDTWHLISLWSRPWPGGRDGDF